MYREIVVVGHAMLMLIELPIFICDVQKNKYIVIWVTYDRIKMMFVEINILMAKLFKMLQNFEFSFNCISTV